MSLKKYTIITPRLGLRNWQESDITPMSLLNQDKKVMEFFPATPTLEQTENFIRRMQAQFEKTGYCYYAVDRLDTGNFIGFIGMMYQDYESTFTPAVDIGWRLNQAAWGNGFATEGAKACLTYGFETLELEEIYSVASVINIKSERVMQKIGMEKIDTFDHPKLLKVEHLKTCVLYRKRRE